MGQVRVQSAIVGEQGITRRKFLQGTAVAAAGLIGAPSFIRAEDLKKQKLRIAYVATGGRAGAHLGVSNSELCVAYSDVDDHQWGDIKKIAPQAPAYQDWRRMFDRHLHEIDVVIIACPDHNHAGPTLAAIQAGKAVYTEKPLTWSIGEAWELEQAARNYQVPTQMGNQGHANHGNRLVVEWIRDGAIGDVLETHTWTNRPIWPQGNLKRSPSKPIPSNLDWDVWIGPAPYCDYRDGLHQFAWRGWFDFGNGALGDMGCHTWDCVNWSMDPDYPTSLELIDIDNPGTESFPQRDHFKWNFPAKGNRPGFVAHWYSGGWKPPAPDEFLDDPVRQKKDQDGHIVKPNLPDSGSLFIGTKGKLLVEGDYGDSPRLIPESAMQAYKRPPESIPPSPGHMEELLMAARGEKPWDFPKSNIAQYSGGLTEKLLIGSIAERIGQVGFKIECDPTAKLILTPEAQAHVDRVPRLGWRL
jgi:predicted dehydrogenase